MGIFSELRRDHKSLRRHLLQISDATGTTRAKLYENLKSAWLAHSRAEEQVLYRTLLDDDRTFDQTVTALDEHRTIDTSFEATDFLSTDDAAWGEAFRVLRAELEHHFTVEETEIFPHAEKYVEDEEELSEIFGSLQVEFLAGFANALPEKRAEKRAEKRPGL